nr:hypothetical protein [Tanacetum cinerariifolium]
MPLVYDDDDDEESSIPLRDIIYELPLSVTITLVLPNLEPEDFLIIGDENFSTIFEKESDEFIKSSVEDLVPIPKYETFSFDIEEKSSGSTTSHFDYSLPDYDAFYFDDDHIEEKSSGVTFIMRSSSMN